MTLTLQQLPDDVDRALRRRAAAEGKSVDQVAVEAIQAGLGMPAAAAGDQTRRDLSDIAGTWIEDPEVGAALREQDRVDAGASR